MATDIERLVVSLEARINQFDKAMAKANGIASSRARQIESRFEKLNANMRGSFSRLGGYLVAGFSANAAKQLIDTSTRIENSLKVAGLEGEALIAVYDKLFASAQKNAAPIEALVDLYGRASLVQKELGVTTAELLGFTDKVAVALRVSGKSASESSGALLQLSQALGSGVVRAEEFNSILEGALPIAQAAAAGLKEAGGSVATLRQLVVDGKVSSEAFFRAFEAGSVILEEKVSGATLTIDQGLTKLQNTLVDAAGKIDDATGASDQLAGALDWLGEVVAGLGGLFANDPLGIGGFISDLETAKTQLRDFLGLTGKGGLDDFLEGTNLLQGKIGFASDQVKGDPPRANATINGVEDPGLPMPGTGAGDGIGDGASLSDLQDFIAAGTRKPKTVSLDDYKPLSKPGGGGGGRDNATAEIERQQKAVEKLIADLAFEQSLIGKSAVEQEVLTTLRRADVDASSEQGLAIKALIEDMHAQQAAQDAIAESLEQQAELAREVGAALAKAFEDGKVTGLELLDILADVARQMALSGLTKLNDSGQGNVFSNLLAGFLGGFSTGTANTGGQRGQVRGLVHGQEAVIPLPAGGKVPVQLRLPQAVQASNAGQRVDVGISVSVDDDGKLQVVASRAGAAAAGAVVNSRVPRMISDQAPRAVQAANMRKRS